MLSRQESPSIIRQKKECNTLDNADKSELDVNDERVQLPATFGRWIHDATRNRSVIDLSRMAALPPTQHQRIQILRQLHVHDQ